MSTNGTATLPSSTSGTAADETAPGTVPLTGDAVWRALRRTSFAVVSHVSTSGAPRSSGVVYGTAGRRLYVAVAANGWKARQIVTGDRVSVTVPVRRGGILALLVPIPPATITFTARAMVHPAGSLDIGSVSKDLEKLVPEERRTGSCIVELAPEGRFLTYGIGVSLMDMANPALALVRVPVS
jgi:hypothetical protein